MSNIEKIKAEIKERIALAEKCADAACEKNLHSTLEANEVLIRQYKSLLAFINSLPDENNPKPYLNEKIAKATKSFEGVDVDKMLAESRGYEEKPCEDLEEAAEEYAYRGVPDELKPLMKPLADEIIKNFIAAAGWQKSQILKDAVEAKIYGYDDGSFELIASWLDIPNNSIYKDGDKVKIIIVKED